MGFVVDCDYWNFETEVLALIETLEVWDDKSPASADTDIESIFVRFYFLKYFKNYKSFRDDNLEGWIIFYFFFLN